MLRKPGPDSPRSPAQSEKPTITHNAADASPELVPEGVGMTDAKIEFLRHAFDDVQETIRFLDTKAGVIIAFEMSLLGGIMMEATNLQLIRVLLNQGVSLYLAFLTILCAVYMGGVVYHVMVTLGAIFPRESPVAHIDTGGQKTGGVFFIWRMNDAGKMQPALPDLFQTFHDMSNDDMGREYCAEILKLSYIRKCKSDAIGKSYRMLLLLCVGVIVVNALLGIGHVMYLSE